MASGGYPEGKNTFSCIATECDHSPWKELEQSAHQAVESKRYFEAVQHINGALEAFEQLLGTLIPSDSQGVLVVEPVKFVQDVGNSLPDERKAELASLYATRADVLLNLGGMKRATNELQAAALLAPGNERVKKLQAESAELAKTTEKAAEESKALKAKNKVPAHILTGFLGSGKTTLLNRILKDMHGKRLAVIENEYGEIGIDDMLICEREDVGEENIIEMNNGCICCSVRGDLIKGLRNILKRLSDEGKHLDGVIIETTGLADPAPVAQTFFADDFIQARMVLDGIITVVDSKHILQHLHEEKPEGVENEAVEQLAFADRVLLNKIDLSTPKELDEVEAEIRKINAHVKIIRTQQSEVDITEIMGIRGFSLDKVLEMDHGFLNDAQDHQHDLTVSSVGIECEGECDLNKLNAWVGNLLKERGVDIFRMKGVLAVRGCADRFVFQGIHMIFSGKPYTPWTEGEKRLCRMIFIGRNLDREELTAGFNSTLASELN